MEPQWSRYKNSSAGGGARRRDKWYMYVGKSVLLTTRVVGRTQVCGEVNHRPRGRGGEASWGTSGPVRITGRELMSMATPRKVAACSC